MYVCGITVFYYSALRLFDCDFKKSQKRRRQCFYISSELKYNSECNIMTEGFRFMPLGLVRLRTFRLRAWVTKVQH